MIIFARHGQTLFGSEGRFEGVSDSMLTDKGKRYAELLGKHLSKRQFRYILVSPKKRALATARIAAESMKQEVVVDNRLEEICYGFWETRKRSEFIESQEWKEREKDFFHFCHPGFFNGIPGESYAQLYERLLPLLLELSNKEENTLVISHAGVLRCARRFFEQVNDAEFKRSKYENSVYYSVKKHNDIFTTALFDVFENRQLSV